MQATQWPSLQLRSGSIFKEMNKIVEASQQQRTIEREPPLSSRTHSLFLGYSHWPTCNIHDQGKANVCDDDDSSHELR